MSENDFMVDKPERTANRIMFVAELVKEVLPDESDRAKQKHIVAENAENYYVRNRDRYLDSPENDILTETAGGDSWVRSSYIKSYWGDIRDYLATLGYIIAWNRRGVYLSDSHKTIEDMQEVRMKAIKKQSDRLTYRAILFNKAANMELPGIVTQVLQLSDG
jgi:hypothetical protein